VIGEGGVEASVAADGGRGGGGTWLLPGREARGDRGVTQSGLREETIEVVRSLFLQVTWSSRTWASRDVILDAHMGPRPTHCAVAFRETRC
jgi:hypothetical protein